MASKIYWILEVLVLSVGLFLNDYSSKRSGLYRHLFYRLYQAETTIINESTKWLWIIGSVLIVLLGFLALSFTDRKIQFCYRFTWRVHWKLLILFAAFIIFCLFVFHGNQEFLMYPYFVVGLSILGLFNLMGCLLIFFFHPEQFSCSSDEKGGQVCQKL